MNVAPAYTVGNAPTAFMAARTSETGRSGAETGTPTQSSEERGSGGPLQARYPIVALSFDQDASRLVMLFRDPATGDAVAQIPSKVVVRQYREAQSEKERDERRKFEVIVGGGGQETESIGEKLAGAKAEASSGKAASSSGAGVALTASASVSTVSVASPPSASASASSAVAPSSAPSGGSGPGLNLVV